MKVKVADLRTKVLAAVELLGYPADEAAIITEVLLYAQLRGNNQGLAKIATHGVPKVADLVPFSLLIESKSGALFAGGQSMVTTVKAANKAVELAASHGVGIVATKQAKGSSGAIGYYARIIASAGYLGYVSVGNGGLSAVAPSGSAETKLGTNPLSYAFPYEGGEVVFDIATAAMARYGVKEYWIRGEQLPEGIAYDNEGNPTTDPAAVLGPEIGYESAGSIQPFAGHKGFGLSLWVQLLGSAFSSAGFPGGHVADGSGTFVLAIDPGLLVSKEEYLTRSRELVESIKSAKPLPGQNVFLPGERGDALALEAERSGEVEISDAIWFKFLEYLES